MTRRRGTARGVLYALAWTVLTYLLVPILVVLPVSVTDTRFLSLPQHGVSVQHWNRFLHSPDWLGSIGQSFLIGLASTAIAVTLGTLCAIGCWRLASRGGEAVRSLMLAPIIVPSIVYALGVYRFWIKLDLLDTYLGVVIAHAVGGLPYVVITVSAALANFDPRLEQAARNLGASLSETIRLVIVPNILPGILSGAIFAFVHSWDELVVTLFISSRRVFTLPRMMWKDINENVDPTIAVAAAALIAFTLILLALEMTLRRRGAAA